MGETRTLRITDPDLDRWIDEKIQKGDLNPIMNHLLERYRQEQEQEYVELQKEERTDRKITVFQGVVFLSVGVFFIVFAASHFYDFLSLVSTFLMILSGVLLCVYVLIATRKRVVQGVE